MHVVMLKIQILHIVFMEHMEIVQTLYLNVLIMVAFQLILVFGCLFNTVNGFYTYMINNGYATSKTWTNGARVGDVVQGYQGDDWHHSVILTGTSDEDGSWVYCSHSNNRKNYPLYSTFTDAVYTDMRTISFLH